jgi:PPP family 3-phenylpropionic acid transporter
LAIHHYSEFAWLTIGFSFFWNAPLPLFEAATLAHLQAEPHQYSRIRLWGSVGFIIAVMGVGKFLDIQPILLLPIIITSFLGLTWLSALTTPESHTKSHGHNSVQILSIVKNPEVIAFLLVFILIQFAHAPYYVFYTIYLKEHLYSTTTTGLLWSLGVVSEIVLFIIMKGMLKRYTLRGILLTSLVFAVIRWALIGNFVDNVYLLTAAQLLHAATFGAAHISAIHFVHRFFDHQHQGKGQALYHSLSFGLGGMLGSLGSGHYWEVMGSHVIFTIAALSCGLAFIVAYIWVGRDNNLLNLQEIK